MKRTFQTMTKEACIYNKAAAKIIVDELDKMCQDEQDKMEQDELQWDELFEAIQWEYEKYAAMDEDFGVEETKEGKDKYTFKEEKVWCDCKDQFSFKVCNKCFN